MGRGGQTTASEALRGRSTLERGSAVWQTVRWPLLGALAAGSFVLGFLGFRSYFDGVGTTKTDLDLVYLSLQLYTLESGSIPQAGVPWQLEVARLAAPSVSALALVTAVAVVFREQIAEWRLRHTHAHVVVCGLGEVGSTLASDLLAAGHQVVAVDADPLAPAVVALRRRGAVVVVGDARDPGTLRRAQIGRASHLISVVRADDANAEIVVQASELTEGRQGPALTCLAHIGDPDLCALLRSEELAASHHGSSRVDFFTVDELGARAMIRDHGPFDLNGTRAPEVLVVGLSPFGQSVVTEIARQWRGHPERARGPVTITIVDPEASEVADRLRRHHPQLDDTARLLPVVARLDVLDSDAVAGSTARIAYVCLDDDSCALQAALTIRNALADPDAPVVVELIHAGGMAHLIERMAPSERIHAFTVLEHTLRADLLLGGTYEVLAQAIHAEYRVQRRKDAASTRVDPSLAPWEALADSLKESNRDQAAHIGTKLAATGRRLAPLTNWQEETSFTEAEVEALAEMEHARWVRQRVRDGWTDGPKDVTARTTPYLVPWAALSEEVKELDRQAVRGIPGFLSRAGYQIRSASTGRTDHRLRGVW